MNSCLLFYKNSILKNHLLLYTYFIMKKYSHLAALGILYTNLKRPNKIKQLCLYRAWRVRKDVSVIPSSKQSQSIPCQQRSSIIHINQKDITYNYVNKYNIQSLKNRYRQERINLKQKSTINYTYNLNNQRIIVFNRNTNFCKGTLIWKIIARAKVDACAVLLKKFTGFFVCL